MSILITILILGILIIAHELGHFMTAKAVGIKVHEFSIGLGPKIFGFQKGETLYSLRLLPLGGFNRMAGMESGDEDDVKGFNTKTVGQRSLVIASGSLMNFLLAIFLFIIVFMGIGIPSEQNVVARIVNGSPADQVGIQAGDKIIAINNQKTETWSELTEIIRSNPQKELKFTILRDNKTIHLSIVPKLDAQNQVGIVGIERIWEKQNVFNSIYLGIKQTITISVLMITSLFQMITGQIPADVAGPVGMVQIIDQAVQFGMAFILNLAAILSLNLGIINLFPIPALDGSRLIFLGIEKLRGRPIQPEKENFVHMIGFFLLIALMIIITYNDVLKIGQ
ncbi:RIP metalloprotease RseP [Bacillota bacterium LX-D]|nr:RIP metalloprotease RseP [Bacillota bacterium LX-D]